MWRNAEIDLGSDDLYLAGEKARPGTYRQIGGSREVRLETEDFLPASLDGRVACYVRVDYTWAQRQTPEAARETRPVVIA